MPDAAAPKIHAVNRKTNVDAMVQLLTSADRDRTGTGLHVVVNVTKDGNVAYGRIHDPSSQGHGSQRWLQHARRGSSPGGWSEEHHPRSEQHVGYWKAANETAIDRVLIDFSKQAWRLDAKPPYVVEFAPVPMPQPGS